MRWAESLESANLHPTDKRLKSFGGRFARFVSNVAEYKGPSILKGSMPQIEQATNAALVALLKTGREVCFIRVDMITDALFDREAKRTYLSWLKKVQVLGILCGVETPHSWSASAVSSVVLSRRYDGLPTLLACTNGAPGIYGAEGKQMFSGLTGYPAYDVDEKR